MPSWRGNVKERIHLRVDNNLLVVILAKEAIQKCCKNRSCFERRRNAPKSKDDRIRNAVHPSRCFAPTLEARTERGAIFHFRTVSITGSIYRIATTYFIQLTFITVYRSFPRVNFFNCLIDHPIHVINISRPLFILHLIFLFIYD
jgi:hypothetical protein